MEWRFLGMLPPMIRSITREVVLKRFICIVAACMLFFASFADPAFAADLDFGFYNIDSAEGVTITPASQSGAVASAQQDLDGDGTAETFYSGSDRLDITLSNAVAENNYIFYLVEGNTMDLDKIYGMEGGKASGSSISVTVFPKEISATMAMMLFITNDNGDPMISVPLNFYVEVFVLPSPVISAAVNNGSVVVSWDAVETATQYALYRRANDGSAWGDWVTLNKKITGTSYTDTSVVPGTAYQYRAKSYNGDWSQAYSNRVDITVPSLTPAAPVIEVTAQPGENVISWAAVNNAEQYRVYRRVNDGSAWGEWTSVIQTETSYTDTSVTAGYLYEYRVKSYGNGEWSGYSNKEQVTGQAPAVTAPAAPEITVSATAEKITVQWQAVPDVVKYQVFRREKSDGKWTTWEIVASAKALSFNDKNVVGGVVYQYRAKSVKTLDDGSSIKSSYSNREMIGLERPDAPVITVTAAAGKNTVKWSGVKGAKSYIVYWRDKASGDWSDWSTTEIQTTSFNHKNVTSGVEYQYRVRASNGLMSEYSNRVAVKAQ